MKPKTKVLFGDVPDLPREVKPAITREINRCLKYLPHWCATLRIVFVTHPGEQTCNAAIQTQPEYFCARLSIYPRWLDMSDEERHHSILHEIGHLHHAQGYQQARAMIEKLSSPEASKLLLELLDRAFEESAEAFALMIERLEQ